MAYFAINFEMEEAVADSFVEDTTGTTVYSNYYDVTQYTEVLIATKYVLANKSGAIITPTLQVYDHITANWYDHTTAFTASNPAGAATQYAMVNINTFFGNRIRVKLVSSGTFGGSETVTTTIGLIGKGS